MSPGELLQSRGWEYDVGQCFWFHEKKGLVEFTIQAALKEEGYAVCHKFNQMTNECVVCGMTRYRMHVDKLPNSCDGVPTPQAFLDRAEKQIFIDRMSAIMSEDGEGWLFDIETDDGG